MTFSLAVVTTQLLCGGTRRLHVHMLIMLMLKNKFVTDFVNRHLVDYNRDRKCSNELLMN